MLVPAVDGVLHGPASTRGQRRTMARGRSTRLARDVAHDLELLPIRPAHRAQEYMNAQRDALAHRQRVVALFRQKTCRFVTVHFQ